MITTPGAGPSPHAAGNSQPTIVSHWLVKVTRPAPSGGSMRWGLDSDVSSQLWSESHPSTAPRPLPRDVRGDTPVFDRRLREFLYSEPRFQSISRSFRPPTAVRW